MEYEQVEGINATAIKAGRKSMIHMRAVMSGIGRKDSPSMRWGRLAHMAVLEPDRFVQLATIFDGSKASKEWKVIKAGAPNVDTIMTSAEMEKLMAMTAKIEACSDAEKLLSDIQSEKMVTWESDTYGAGKARLDGHNQAYIVEYKTAKDIDEKSFIRQSIKLGYDIAAGWYRFGAIASGIIGSRADFIFIVQEAEFPFEVAVYQAPKSMLEIGYAEAERIAKEYRQCEKSGIWTGVQIGGMKELEMPEWYGFNEIVNGMEDGDASELEDI